MSQRSARRGAVVVLLAIMMVALAALAAIALDMSRLWALRNELQTSADAAAHAGAVQLLTPNVAMHAVDSAIAFAKRNRAMQDTVTVDSVQLGGWDDGNKTFTPGGANTNAVHVVVSRQSTGLVMAVLRVPLPRIKARATGWADAPVSSTGCVKPWAIPYVTLMERVNAYLGIPNTWANLNRPFGPADYDALRNMTAADRTFNLKLGSGTQIVDTSQTTMPGNYQAVELPRFWEASTGTYTGYSQGGGATEYRDNVSGATCHGVGVGDSLFTLDGDQMRGPTVLGANAGDGVGPGPCEQILGHIPYDRTPKSDPAYGDCLAGGNPGVDVKAIFYACPSHCNGATKVEVSMLGSFSLRKVYPENDDGGNKRFYEAQIVGIFLPVPDNGTVGGSMTTLRRPILVR